MKKIFIPVLAAVLASCGKDSPVTPPGPDSTEIVKQQIQGEWKFYRIDEKSIVKSSTGGTVLNPDGSPVDTVRATKNINGYWTFKGDSLVIFDGIGFERFKFSINVSSYTIQPAGRDPYKQIVRTDTEYVLDKSSVSPVSGNKYTEYFARYYLKR